MKPDSALREDVEAELEWTRDVDQTDIAVKVHDGIVALNGYVPSYHQKYRAEAAAKRVSGVKAVANDLAVRLPLGSTRTDPEIARDVVAALQSALPASADSVKPIVHEGRVALEGTLEWHFERDRAEKAARRVRGVVSVRNSIALRTHTPSPAAPDIKRGIEDAFRRNALIDAQSVRVEAQGSEVILRGEVRSWSEHDQAEQTAWTSPGVVSVKNEITIRT
jgi:osmotically-inducible protein OsmY